MKVKKSTNMEMILSIMSEDSGINAKILEGRLYRDGVNIELSVLRRTLSRMLKLNYIYISHTENRMSGYGKRINFYKKVKNKELTK